MASTSWNGEEKKDSGDQKPYLTCGKRHGKRNLKYMPMKTMKKMKKKQMKARNGLTAIGFMLLFVILWIGALTPAQTQVIAIGGSSYEYARSIIQTTDGGYAVAGYTGSFGAGNYDVYVVKLDGSGNIQWTRTIGEGGDDRGYSIIQTMDGDMPWRDGLGPLVLEIMMSM
jgi:hypothetical protein